MNHPTSWPTTRASLLSNLKDSHDEAAWQVFLNRYGPAVYDFCRAQGLQHVDAQDIVQDVFLRVSRAIGSFEYDANRGRFRSWLGLISHQQILRYRQKQTRADRLAGAISHDLIADTFEGEIESAWLEAFNAHMYLGALEAIRDEFDADEWRAFECVWDGHQRPAEVARLLNHPPEWLYQVKHKIVCRLKEEIALRTENVAAFNRP